MSGVAVTTDGGMAASGIAVDRIASYISGSKMGGVPRMLCVLEAHQSPAAIESVVNGYRLRAGLEWCVAPC